MDKLEFIKVLTAMAALYPRFKLTHTTIDAYFHILRDLPIDALKAATLHLGGTSKWFPTAAELRATSFELMETDEQKLSAFEAWREVLDKIDRYEPPKPKDFTNPIVFDALEAIGGNLVLCDTPVDSLHTARARYIQAYTALLGRAQETRRMLPEVKRTAVLLAGRERPALEAAD